MAKRNGKNRKARRKNGEPFGTLLVTNIVLQAISGVMTETEFMAAYDGVPRHRRGGSRGIPEKVRAAYAVFQKSDGSQEAFSAFVDTIGKSAATAERYLGRLALEERSAS